MNTMLDEKEQPATIANKLDVIRKELLDPSLRNPLLNYRPKALGLEVKHDTSQRVFELLVTQEKTLSFSEELGNRDPILRLLAHDTLLRPNKRRYSKMPAPFIGEFKIGDRSLQTHYSNEALDARLLKTYRLARSLLQEQGANSLFLSFGMLEWYEAESSDTLRSAPLLLAPVLLEKLGSRQRFGLEYTGDEVQDNMSLSLKLGDFGVKLPRFEDGDYPNLKAYFDDVRMAIDGLGRWRVRSDYMAIAFFSFSRALMYRDLDVTQWPKQKNIQKHNVITSLLGVGFSEPQSIFGESDDTRLDDIVKPTQAYHVMDADGSQLAAITDAIQGRNLVIQGPPGTGKSQTIANLIAECVGLGKRVLFVAEKQAALDVVKRRLDNVDLGAVCLELHSNKANKKELLNELRQTLELGRPQSDNFKDDLRRLEQYRTELNQYADAVNTPIKATGYSLNQAIGELQEIRSRKREVTLHYFNLTNAADWSKQDFIDRKTVVANSQDWCQRHGVPSDHLFWGSKKKSFLPSEEREIHQKIQEAVETLENVTDIFHRVATPYGRDSEPQAFREIQQFGELLDLLYERPPQTAEIDLEDAFWSDAASDIADAIEAEEQLLEIHNRYQETLTAHAWAQDVEPVRSNLSRYGRHWWRFLIPAFRKSTQAFLQLFKVEPPVELEQRLQILDDVAAAQDYQTVLKNHESVMQRLFGDLWNGSKRDIEALKTLFAWITEVYKRRKDARLPEDALLFLRTSVAPSDASGFHKELQSAVKRAVRALNDLFDVLLLEKEDARRQDFYGKTPSQLAEQLTLWKANLQKLHGLVSLNNLIDKLRQCSLDNIARYLTNLSELDVHIADAFEYSWFEAIVEYAQRQYDVLHNFNAIEHERKLEQFRELDTRFLRNNRVRLAQIHHNNLPLGSNAGQVAILRREFEKKARHLPIRQLMKRAGNAIQNIKPIFMMSPLSVAQYLPPGDLEFDLVIFDEASQIKPADAFGAILRGKQVVVVGDSKQLPPTDFFSKILQSENEEETATSDIESVLGLFVSKGAPSRMLRWHYRSRHESLIAVSNYEFYDNRLLIFPSPASEVEELGVKLRHHGDTVYDRGKSRTNQKEARAVAEAVMKHARETPELSLGVVAFSSAQMKALEEQIDRLRREDQSLEHFFDDESPEPFFVKNLETVQGDERDVIFISIGHGYDVNRHFRMAFGPLNEEGGERRLNVLITRAKQRCEVFANFTADDIDLSRTQAWGVQALKKYLKYAETGKLSSIASGTEKTFESPFEQSVHNELQALGFDVRTQVGTAGYFIDLAIVSPEQPGRYLIGIECDGASYHSSREARDRDRLRQEVLEGLGWTIYRIWSTDWFKNPDRELKALVEAINKAKTIQRTADDLLDSASPQDDGASVIQRDATELPVHEQDSGEFPLYQIAQLESIRLPGDTNLHEVDRQQIALWIVEIAKVESPVHIDEITRRIIGAADIKRAGNLIKKAIREGVKYAARHHNLTTRQDFIWLGEQTLEETKIRDRSELPDASRKVMLIAPEEIDAAIIYCCKTTSGVSRNELPSVASRYFGFARAGKDINDAFMSRVSHLLDREILKEQDEYLVLA